MKKYYQLADLLLTLEMHMRQGKIWDMSIPSEQDLASVEPFCIDTIGFDQWLRFVMLARYKAIIEQQHPLPTHSNIRPIADMFFKEQKGEHIKKVLNILEQFDSLINK